VLFDVIISTYYKLIESFMMKKHELFCCVLFALLFCLNGCKQKSKEGIAVIVTTKIFDSIPSGSGMDINKDSLFIIGDDAGSIYQLSLKNHLYKKMPLPAATPERYRFEKEGKPDYESAAIIGYRGGHYLFAFGSGSKSPERDSLLIVDLDAGRVDTVISIKPFYDHLVRLGNMKVTDLNMEGAAVVRDKLMLLNRGNNMIFSFDAEKFIESVLTHSPPPAIHSFRAKLPSIDKFEARLSGAAASGDDLLFCASVEKTEDWTKDGPIAGSYVGLIDERKEHIKLTAKLTYPDGKIAVEKIESIAFLRKETNGDFTFLAIADNDDGKTKLLEIKIKLR
jgi:hypothetical protein